MLRTCMQFFRFVLVLTRPLSDRILDLIYRLIMGKTKELPAIDNKILLMTATELAEKIRKKQAAKHFEEEYDIKPSQIQLGDLRYAFNMWECRVLEIQSQGLIAELAEDADINLYWEIVKSLFRCSDHTLPIIYNALIERNCKDKFYYRCLKRFKELERKFEEILEGDAILLLPTQPEPPLHYLMTIPKFPNLGYNGIFNILGYPVTQVPGGFSRGLPVGIQVAGRRFQDHLTLAAGMELDKIFGGWKSPCSISV